MYGKDYNLTMEPSKAAMKAALRVLTALSERHAPDQADVDELHWYAPSDRGRPIDELVCDAIQRALQEREQKRKASQARLRESALRLPSAEPAAEPDGLPQRAERDPQLQQLIREHAARRQEYLALGTRLKRIATVLQLAAENLLAAASGSSSASSETAREIVASLAGEVDLSGLMQLLNEHVRLAKHLLADEQTLRRHGIE